MNMFSSKKKKSDKRQGKKSSSRSSKAHKSSRSVGHIRHLYIIVYRGDPTDDANNRHTALFVSDEELDDTRQRSRNSMIHVFGQPGFFELEERRNVSNPVRSRSFVQAVYVDTIEMATSRGLEEWILQTPVRNDVDAFPEWNCQTFVTDALQHLLDNQVLSDDSFTNGTNQMFDALDVDIITADDPAEWVGPTDDQPN